MSKVCDGTILVVDRNPTKLSQLCRILSGEGHRIVTAVDADTAVAASRQHQPDLVVLDSVLPGSDGESLLCAMRTAMNGCTPPAFLLTTSESECSRARSLGAVASFRKPFAVEDLLVAVRSFVADLSVSPS